MSKTTEPAWRAEREKEVREILADPTMTEDQKARAKKVLAMIEAVRAGSPKFKK